jgi:dipeptidyl aminopeptidase/acylaminoacyl peptidase
LLLLNRFVAEHARQRQTAGVTLKGSPYGPSSPSPALAETVTADWSQVTRTALDVDDYFVKQERVPGTVWLGSAGVPPEVYLRGLARVAVDLLNDKETPKTVEFKPAKLEATKYVADDDAKLWGWVIFPSDFHAPALMELAKRQAWTLKPALLDGSRE